jgi:PAS domain S-box-containing protein
VTVMSTQSQKTEVAEQVHNSASLWGDLVHSMRDIAYVLNTDGTYKDVNQQMSRLFRRPPDQIIGQHFSVNLDKEQAAVATRIHKEILARRTTERSTRTFSIAGSEPQYFEVIESPLIRNGEVWAVIGVGRDITQEAILEHKLWDSVETQRYAIDFALRTSLGLVKGYIYTLGQSALLTDDRRIRYMRIVEEEMEHLAKIIEDMLDFRRLEVGNYDFSHDVVNLSECIELAVLQFRDEAARREIDLSVIIPDKMDPLYLYAEAVNRVIINLVQNAILHTLHSGRITIEVQDNELYVDIVIKDNGVGISEDDLPYIFDKFYRGKGSQELPTPGIGMGLAVVKTLVMAMGGRVWAISQEGNGSEFHVVLPRRVYGVSDTDNTDPAAMADGISATLGG